MYSRRDDTVLTVPGFPIRKSPDQSLLSGSPKLIAASHVLRRLLAPRHPPCALSSLTTMQKRACACTRRLPVTHRFSCQRARTASLSDAVRKKLFKNSGADGHRTHDPRLAKPVLSQLSYSPIN